MELSHKMHQMLEKDCKTACTGKLGWNRQRRQDCRVHSMCPEVETRMNKSTEGEKALCSAKDMYVALRESVKLQSHYAELLNWYDSGKRISFTTPEEWIARLREIGLDDEGNDSNPPEGN